MKTLPKLGRILVLALCCVLMLFMTAELTHAHPSGKLDDTAHCPFCIAAHIALHSAVVLSASLTLAVLGRIAVRQALPAFRQARFTHRIRPPPAFTSVFAIFTL